MKRLSELEARRRTLLARCDQQRVDIMYRIAQIGPMQLTGWAGRAQPSGLGLGAGGLPLAWLAGLAGVLFMIRPRRLVKWVTWVTGAVSLAARAMRVLRVFQQLRAARARAR